MAIPKFTIRELMEAGVHFGHKTKRWNPKMAPYLYGIRKGIHIIDLQQTAPLLFNALRVARNIASNNGRILFVGTKRQGSDAIREAAARCGQYYVNHRWLGGMLTNWSTIQQSIKSLRDLEEQLEDEVIRESLTKNEILQMTRRRDKLMLSLGGIRDMAGIPDLIFVLDTNKEKIAVQEATRLGIPVIGVLDSNSDPSDITLPIPGNDDSLRSIDLYCRLISEAALDGLQEKLGDVSFDRQAKAAVEEAQAEEEAAAEETIEEKTVAKGTVKAESKSDAMKKQAKAEAEKKAPAKKAAAKTKKTEAVEEKAEDKETKTEKKTTAKKAPAKKTTAKKATEKDAGEKKTAAKKTTVKKAAAKSKKAEEDETVEGEVVEETPKKAASGS